MRLRAPAFLVCLIASMLCNALPAAATVDVALIPSASLLPPDTDVWVTLRVTQAGSLFNGYTATIDFDPAALEFVPEPTQQGAYMLGACGNTFHSFNAQTNQLTIQHYLFCSGTSLSGPGDLYVLHFRTAAGGGSTAVSFSQLRFYNVGHPVAVGSMVNATIQIEGPTDATDGFAAARRGLFAMPNPFAARTVLHFQAGWSGTVHVTIHDVRGRRVRSLTSVADARGHGTAMWDGLDDAQRAVAAGAYVAFMRTAHGVQTRRIVLTH